MIYSIWWCWSLTPTLWKIATLTAKTGAIFLPSYIAIPEHPYLYTSMLYHNNLMYISQAYHHIKSEFVNTNLREVCDILGLQLASAGVCRRADRTLICKTGQEIIFIVAKETFIKCNRKLVILVAKDGHSDI